MPEQRTYPGVYIEELPSGVRTITGVATSVAAFVGYTARGLDHRARRMLNFSDFERAFGGLAADSEVSYAVQQFFNNGGSQAYVVRVPKNDAVAGRITLKDGAQAGSKPALTVAALSTGARANNVIVDVDYGAVGLGAKAFNLTITDRSTNTTEVFSNVTMDSTKSNYVVAVVNDADNGSQLVSLAVSDVTAGRPMETGTVGGDIDLSQIKNDKPYTLTISSDVPSNAINHVDCTFIAPGEPIPSSIAGVCRLLESKVNLTLQATLPGASIRCVPSASGKGLRINAQFPPELVPGALDAKLTFGTGAPDDAAATLKLTAGVANVAHYWVGQGRTTLAQTGAALGVDGTKLPVTADLIGSPNLFTGLYALDKVDLFNILCIPDATRSAPGNPAALDSTVDPNSIFGAAMMFCKQKRAFLLVDSPPNVANVSSGVDWISSGLTIHDLNGAAYFPRLKLTDPLNNDQLRQFAPCGVVAGLYARTNVARGVWKAPAGREAKLSGVQGLAYTLTDGENGRLNLLGLNCFRTFPVYGTVAWGARTLVGSDAEASDWKYVPVRRLALFLEESLYRGTQWVVFEPNDEPLWSQIRLNLGAFLHNLFRQGAFQGTTPRDAYFVKCDKETTTQNDINLGIVNIVVGFAPLKPAEFVIIKLQQMAGQIAT
ncbi:MAG: phage tail sheath C-terminal domain-containing protein [Nitrospira sp.]